VATADAGAYEAWLRLTLVKGLGGAAVRQLLTAFGPPQQVLDTAIGELRRHVSPELASAIADGGNADAARNALAWLNDPGNRVVALGDADYPQLLLQIPDPPPLLYVKGDCSLLNRFALAVVGSRNASAQGATNAEEFARALSDAGITIVSGLALGVDAAAHRGGLAGKSSSIAVVGTGLDIVYPARNRALAHALAERGALVSEFPLGTPALAGNFPRRNRVISGLSRGCLVIEAALQSGSLITARLANEQGREVFALPGSIHSPLAKGCHRLIKQGAKLVDDANDILEEFDFARATASTAAPVPTGAAAADLLETLGHDPCAMDALATRAGLPAETVAALLLELELSGLIEKLPGNVYRRIR
jgi:DNA processing protein